MANEQVFVDNELFLGREDAQNQFRQALNTVLASGRPGSEPFIFLIQGTSGSGKSKMLRRLRDIAASETPFDSEIQTVLADWQVEQFRHVELVAPPRFIQPEVILNRLYRMGRDAGWGHHFSDFQTTIRETNAVERKVADWWEQATWSQEMGALRILEGPEMASLIRRGPAPGSALELPLPSVSNELATGDSEALQAVSEQVRLWLTDRLGLETVEEQLFFNPSHSMAHALGLGFAKVARSKPLVILMDNYEAISAIDRWMHSVVRAAGSRVIWVIAAETDGGLDEEAYSNIAQRLVQVDLPSFSQAEVAEYLRSRSPDRLLTRMDAETILGATRGYPLALEQCADLWASGVPLDDITAGLSEIDSQEEVLETLSQRLLAFCHDPSDREALLLMALQRRPHEELQIEVMRPDSSAFDYDQRLERLQIRYFSVRDSGGAIIHNLIGSNLRAYLTRHRLRISDEVKALTTTTTEVIDKAREKLESGFARLEDRLGSDEWRQIMVDHVHWLFWHNEFNAWRQFNRDFVDALGYDLGMAATLIKVVDRAAPLLSRDGRQRYRIMRDGLNMRAGGGALDDLEVRFRAETAMLEELDRWLTRYGGKDFFNSERRAILDLLRGELRCRQQKYEEAFDLYLRAEKNLPSRGEILTRRLGRAFEALGYELAWERNGLDLGEAQPSTTAERALRKALNLGRRRAKTYHTLGAVQLQLEKKEAALENLLQTVTLNPGDKFAWKDLGDVYLAHQMHEKAIPAYRRAIEIDSQMITAQLSLAVCLREVGQEEEYEQRIEGLRDLVAERSEYTRARYEAVCGNVGPALAFLKIALSDNQVSRDKALLDPYFDLIRNQDSFQQLVVD